MSQERRTALVTGAGRGIGRGIALALAADGFAVAVNDRDEEPAAAVAREITDSGGAALPFAVSVDDYEGVEQMVKTANTELGPVSVLVSNAGIPSSGKSVLYTEMDEFEDLLRVHTLGAVALSRAVLPTMRTLERSHIVLISSMAAMHVMPKSGPYSMAKVALETLGMTLAKEEERYGVRVNWIRPGFIDTRLGRLVGGRMGMTAPADTRPSFMGDPGEIGDAVRFLVSDEGDSVTGQCIPVGPSAAH